MKLTASTIDPSILPEQACRELDGFYRFLNTVANLKNER